MERLWMVALIGAGFLAGCAGINAPPAAGSRHNTAIDPTDIVGAESADWDTPPKLISGKRPIYPISQVLNGNSGSAILAFTIDVDGRARGFEVLEASDKRFADHAIIAVREWTWQPATKDGAPIAARVSQSFEFGTR